MKRSVFEHGSLDILAAAGIGQPIADVIDTTERGLRPRLRDQCRGRLYTARARPGEQCASRKWAEHYHGSQTGKVAWPEWGINSASNHAVVGLTRVLALEPTIAPNGDASHALWMGSDVTICGATHR